MYIYLFLYFNFVGVKQSATLTRVDGRERSGGSPYNYRNLVKKSFYNLHLISRKLLTGFSKNWHNCIRRIKELKSHLKNPRPFNSWPLVVHLQNVSIFTVGEEIPERFNFTVNF